MKITEVLPKTSWYLGAYRAAINAQGRLYAGDIQRRETAYLEWYKKKSGKDWTRGQETAQPEIRSGIFRPSIKVIGYRDGLPVTVRTVGPAARAKDHSYVSRRAAEITEIRHVTCAPAHYVVAHGGRRIDSFLKAQNAAAAAERLVEKVLA